MELLLKLLLAGLNALIEYVAYHVVTCLIPAFLIAGALTTFLSKDVVVRYLGSLTKKYLSFPLAAASGMVLAVCSCTVIPIAAGLYRKGSSLGPAFIILWTAPATNLLALVYTGAILGMDMAAARAFAAVSTAFLVGLLMTWVFSKEEADRSRKSKQHGLEARREEALAGGPRSLGLILLLLLSLLAPNYLGADRPYYFKLLLFSALLSATFAYAFKYLDMQSIKGWLRETLWFVRLIFPLLIAGVFVVGVVGEVLPKSIIQSWFSGNGLVPTFLACLIGAVVYFATLTEAPFVSMLMSLGMGKAPALALLLAGPGLSLPNMLAVARIFTAKKAAVYVAVTVTLATLTAFVIGNLVW